MSVVTYTMVSPDGVIGLNGRHYLLDNDDEMILFKSIETAKEFLINQDIDPEDEYIDYAEIDEDGNEYDLYHDGTRVE